MSLILAAALAASQPASSNPTPAFGQPSWIVATIHHSEWCPAGYLRLDLRTGQFDHVAGAARDVCEDIGLERPVIAGIVGTEQLERVRAAFMHVQVEGVETPGCRDDERPETILVSNGGTPLLVLTTGAETGWAPENRGCWSDAANALHGILEDIVRRDRSAR